MMKKTEKCGASNTNANNLDSLVVALFGVFNGYDTGKLSRDEVECFVKSAGSIVSTESQILKKKKFEEQLKSKHQIK